MIALHTWLNKWVLWPRAIAEHTHGIDLKSLSFKSAIIPFHLLQTNHYTFFCSRIIYYNHLRKQITEKKNFWTF